MLIIRKKQESCILKSAGEKSTKVCFTPHHKSGELGQIMSLGLLLNQVRLHFSKERRIVYTGALNISLSWFDLYPIADVSRHESEGRFLSGFERTS